MHAATHSHALSISTITILHVDLLIYRAAVLTGRYQMRSGFYPKGLDPNDIGGID